MIVNYAILYLKIAKLVMIQELLALNVLQIIIYLLIIQHVNKTAIFQDVDFNFIFLLKI